MPATKQKKGAAKESKAAKQAGELFLIDGNSLAYRAFFALPESIATHDGRPTNAIYGLASMFAKMLIDHDPGGRRGRLGRGLVGPGSSPTSPTRPSGSRGRTCSGSSGRT